VLLALGSTAVALVALASIDPSILCVLPALSLVLLLALRRYPGENALVALAARRSPGPARRIRAGLRLSGRWAGPAIPRGGLLLACSLADRPPPLALATR